MLADKATVVPVQLPIIDLAELGGSAKSQTIIDEVSDAAAEFGFFQIVNHGIADDLVEAVWHSTEAFFALPQTQKRAISRSKTNARGYYDRELTKNARDLKEVLDLAHVPFPDLDDDDPRNFHRVDGFNQWPQLAGFRSTMVAYLQACEHLSLRLLDVFSAALGQQPAFLRSFFGPDHTSFVRLNHYPLDDILSPQEATSVTPLGDMALHHHSDAGALTILLQDDVGGLQVEHGQSWIDVEPIPGALVVNIGDMMQVWANDRFQAALHRVTPTSSQTRYSLPYFFNPSYETDYSPLPSTISADSPARYRTLNWGDFRQARADGDFADYGTEIQIAHFRV